MKSSKLSLLALVAFVGASVAQAHPGHDGHELVWEYSGGHLHLDALVWVTLAVLTISAVYRYAKKQG